MKAIAKFSSFAILAAALTTASIAHADDCIGTVTGISGAYNEATGSGFLAVRELPRASANKLAELFNGDTVIIEGRKGGWYQVVPPGGGDEGWASAKWLSNSCGY